ncbi:MAG: hypothetical protein AB1413_04260 [Thermodesulfobacteriota bacterium]
MSEAPQAIIEQVHALLQTTMTVTSALMTNDELRQWDRINFEKAGQIFDSFGLTDNYKKALDTYKSEPKEILRSVERLENELKSLALDLKRQAIKPAAALSLARRLEQECDALAEPLSNLQEQCALLLSGQKRLRERLTLPNLVPLAKECKEIHADRVDEGYRFLCFVHETAQEEAGGPSLPRCQARATKLEQKFKAIEFRGLPGLAAAVLEHQVYAAVRAADQIKAYIEDFHQYPPGEMEKVLAVKQQLEKLREAELATLLKELPELILAVGNTLSALYNRAKALRQMELLPVFLKHLDLLYATISGPLLDDLKRQVRETGSPLNPASVAAEKVPDFFMGLQGFVRTLKLLLQSLSGQKSITTAELQDKAVAVLNSCHTYYGTTEGELTKLKNFLEEHLAAYSRPFPHDALFQFMKGLICTYGSRMEQYVNNYKLVEFTVMEDRSDKNEAKGKMTLGRLVAKVTTWTDQFEVY